MKKIIVSMLSSVMIFTVLTTSIYADETQTTKNSDGTITQKIYDTPKDKIQFEGKTYILETEKKSKEEVRDVKTLTENKTYENLEEKQVPQTLDVEYNGEKFTLKLSDVQYTEKEIENGTINLTGTIDYGFLTERPAIAPTKEVTYTDNNKQLTTTIPYSYINQSEEYWKSGFNINGRYIGDDDTMYFNFNGTLIPNTTDGSVPYKNYENTILQSLGINPNKSRIDSANWTNTYQNNGQQVKECVFNVSYYGADYIANYSDTITGHKTVYEANAIYSLENVDVLVGEREYMEVTYTPQSNKLLRTTTTAIIFGLIMVSILLILKKKSEKQ